MEVGIGQPFAAQTGELEALGSRQTDRSEQGCDEEDEDAGAEERGGGDTGP
jgi:hypothetical protein